MTTSSITITAIPAPIPAFAPVLRPWLAVSGESEEAAVDEEAAVGEEAIVGEPLVVVCEPRAVMAALEAAGNVVDDGAAAPKVAASTNRLELIPQQLLSPQQ
jgi:hypothetical protein